MPGTSSASSPASTRTEPLTHRRDPLCSLLSRAWVAYVMETDNLVEAMALDEPVGRLFKISFAMWANGLRWLDDDGTAVADLTRRAGAATNLGGMERWRWIEIGTGGGDRRPGYGTSRGIGDSTLVRPSPAGRYARRVWPEAVEAVHGRWRDRFGDDALDRLAAALDATPEHLASERLPWAPPVVGPADGFRTRVLPTDRAADTQVPLVVRLGQVLAGRTLTAEAGSAVSLPLAANLLRVLPDDDAVPARELPRLTGVSREAIAMATGYARRRGLIAEGAARSYALTDDGRAARAEWASAAGEQEGTDAASAEEPLRAALLGVLDQHDALAAGLTPPEGCWRNQRPYLSQTERLVDDPMSALPWQPMVLHRGGWPDGS